MIYYLSFLGVLVLGPFCAEMHTPVEAAVSIFHLILMDTQFEMDQCASAEISRLKGELLLNFSWCKGIFIILELCNFGMLQWWVQDFPYGGGRCGSVGE